MPKLKNNQNGLNKIQSTQILKHLPFLGLGILSWLGFSYLFILYIKILQGRSLYEFPWHYDAPIWAFRQCLMGAGLIISAKWIFGLLTEDSRSIFRDFTILILFIPVNSSLITAFHTLILGATFSDTNSLSYDLVMGFLHGFVLQTFVAMTCIGYFYLSLVNQTKERLTQAQIAKSEMELKTLQQKIEPHFLFNNLNVLSSLIESNPTKANVFLDRLAELYRYLLITQTLEVVPLADELTFAQNYIYLLQERFGNAYNFNWRVSDGKLNGQMIVPVALQTLIENAVKHNAGNQKKPLQVSIELGDDDETHIIVENEVRCKLQTQPTSKTGLENLMSRYAILSEHQIEISREKNFFRVKLPLLKLKR